MFLFLEFNNKDKKNDNLFIVNCALSGPLNCDEGQTVRNNYKNQESAEL